MKEETSDTSPNMADAVLACLFGLSGSAPLLIASGAFAFPHIFYLWILTLMASLIILMRRTVPNVASTLLIITLIFRCLLFPNLLFITDIIVLIMVYTASARARVPVAVLVILSAIGSLTFIWVQRLPQYSWQDAWLFVTVLALIGTTSLAGFARRSQRDQAQKFQAAERLLQQETSENQRGAIVRERTRIARDLHDIVAHTLGVVIAQADGGRYAGRKDPEQALRALDTISDMSRAALSDIRSIVGVLREPSDFDSSLTPQPVTHDIASLIERVKESGIDIAFVELGVNHPLPAGIGNALFRICQESVTNSMKHGGPHVAIVVKLEWQDRDVSLSIVDNGRGASVISDGKGNGIIGMSERAALFGGTLESGARPGGGFMVRATIPYDRDFRERRTQ
ncbi:Sensor histidine kinase desK [Arcanobacterium haemolyticum]|uniref:sensor histidine kinase n=1 Tax=Arcanobacterium haemolyticum TaxID=28264 RepID=UPI000D996DB1|nr:sensor histidine kinase [Arcanobacterium haemolyticum]SPT75121.1 Sensor histidine kinase desK [Arcanobacterium haemolyticum]